jgi:heat shock protein HslJ
MADAATFSLCLTGRSYPVAMEGAYIDADRAYLALEDRDPGEEVLAVLEGTLAMRPAMEGPDRTHVVIDRFSRFAPGDTCDRSRADAALTDTYWRLLEIGGDEIAPMEGSREPYLILHSPDGDPTTSFNATVGCNMMRGGYERGAGDALSFGEAAMTMMACPPPLDTRERALTEALGQVARLQITATTLELFDESGTRMLMAEAVYLP